MSKAYGVIDRFSEDIDITYDIRAIARDLTKDSGTLPKTTSQAKKWTKKLSLLLEHWIVSKVCPMFQSAL